MRISTAQWFRQGTNAMLDNQASLSHTQLQMATGRRMLAPSDDPAAASRVLELDQKIGQLDQYQRNADFAEMRLRREEETLQGMGDVLQRVRELAVQGLNDSLSVEDRNAIAQEVRQHLDSLVSLANEQDVNGDYIFAGYRTSTPPIVDEGSGNYVYAGDQGQRLLQIGTARHVATNDAGSRVFMGIDDGNGGRTDLFSIVYGFMADLETGSPDDVVLTRLDNAMERLNDVRASVGGRLNAIDNQRGTNDSLSLVMQENRSSLQDLDYAEAVARLQKQMLVLQASQQTFTKVEGLSLFNYL